jgi:nitroreductase
VVDNPEFINGITEVYKKVNPKVAEDPGFKNMFRNAPTVVFIANDTSYDMSQIDCGLLGENMILSAWSMGIGSCCLGSSIRFMKTEPQAADYLKRLNIPEGYELLYCIAFGYPDESPAAKPRDASKVMFVE